MIPSDHALDDDRKHDMDTHADHQRFPMHPDARALWDAGTHYAAVQADSIVLLGNKALVAAQRARDGESLAALVCGYGPMQKPDA